MSDAVKEKHVSAKAPYGFEILGLQAGETITACTCVATPTGLTLTGAVNINGNVVSQFVEGGTAEVDYRLRFHITTNLGYQDDFDYVLKVIA